MAKQLRQWLDEFVNNGADPKNVIEWPSNAGGAGLSIAVSISGSGYGTLKAFDGDTELEVIFVREVIVENPYKVSAEFNIIVPLNKEIHFEYTPLYTLDSDLYINIDKIDYTFENHKALFSYTFTIGGLVSILDYDFE